MVPRCIGAMINKGGIGYGMTRYGWIADMVLGWK